MGLTGDMQPRGRSKVAAGVHGDHQAREGGGDLADNDKAGADHALLVAPELYGTGRRREDRPTPKPTAEGGHRGLVPLPPRPQEMREELLRIVEGTPTFIPDMSTSNEMADTRPVIQITADLELVGNQAVEALKNAEIYVRGRSLVRVVRDGGRKIEGLSRPAGAPVIVPVVPETLQEILTRVARWERWNEQGGKWVRGVPSLTLSARSWPARSGPDSPSWSR